MSPLLDAYGLLQAGAEALAVIERNGIGVDVPYCQSKVVWLDGKIDQAKRRLERTELTTAWRRRFGDKADYGSPGQLRAVLYADLGVKPFKRTAGGDVGIDEESLRQVDLPGIDNLLTARRYKKARDVLSGFLRYQVNGRMHPSFPLHTVATYRSSSVSPNCQNVPKRNKEIMDICRRAIVPLPGHVILEIDGKGMEISISACHHKDPQMIAYLNDPSSDMHADMAQQIFKLPNYNRRPDGFGTLRQAAKNGFVFPEFYGDYFETCANNMACSWLKMPRTGLWRPEQGVEFAGQPIGRHLLDSGFESLPDFTDHVRAVEGDFWGKRFRVYNQWKRDWFARYQRRGSFEMKTGFQVAGLLGKNMVINYPVQGAAFHCLLWVLIQLRERLRGWRSLAVGEIHDSVLIDAHPDEVPRIVEIVKRLFGEELPEAWRWIIVPLLVEIECSAVDGNWAEMEVVK